MEKFRFEDLKVYQKSLNYVDFVYALSEKFPKHEIYTLSSQFRRASNSISLNIGEGESGTTKEYINFLRISRRSVRECVVCTTLARRRKYISDDEEITSREHLIELSKMLSGLMNSLK
jgi:four helix bundle protein